MGGGSKLLSNTYSLHWIRHCYRVLLQAVHNAWLLKLSKHLAATGAASDDNCCTLCALLEHGLATHASVQVCFIFDSSSTLRILVQEGWCVFDLIKRSVNAEADRYYIYVLYYILYLLYIYTLCFISILYLTIIAFHIGARKGGHGHPPPPPPDLGAPLMVMVYIYIYIKWFLPKRCCRYMPCFLSFLSEFFHIFLHFQ